MIPIKAIRASKARKAVLGPGVSVVHKSRMMNLMTVDEIDASGSVNIGAG